MTRTALYRHYAADGALLYVGITKDPAKRFAMHKGQSDWSFDVATIAIEWFPDRADAMAAEAVAVAGESPRYNYQHSRIKPARVAPPVTAVKHPDLIASIEAFCEATGTPTTAFGQQCLSDPSLVKNLRDGRELRTSTVAKILSFMGVSKYATGREATP
jgi:2,4-dienoyl-CoA reductase-like NADH-dependent reductase (Old Yellow Enzyme family)